MWVCGCVVTIVKIVTLLFTVRMCVEWDSITDLIQCCIGNRQLTAILKDTKGPHSHYDEGKMGPYSQTVIENFHSCFKFKAEAPYEECGVGVTGMMLQWRKTLLTRQWIYCTSRASSILLACSTVTNKEMCVYSTLLIIVLILIRFYVIQTGVLASA